MTQFEELIKRVDKAASRMGGLIAILLAVKERRSKDVTYDGADFYVKGVKVKAELINREMARVELKVGLTIISYNKKLWDRTWTLSQWQKAMERLTEENHLLFAALAWGGVEFVLSKTEKDRAAAEILKRRTERDLKAVGKFAQAIKDKQVPNEQATNNRGRSYIRAWFVTYHILSHRAHIIAGYHEAKNMLTIAEHCKDKKTASGISSGCLELNRKGWLPIREMTPIGLRTCKQWCKCYIIYR